MDQSGEQVYFGLAGTNLLDDERTVAFFQPDRERFLEYDLTRLVYDLSNPQRPVIGVMSPLPLNGDPRAMMMRQPQLGQPAVVMTQLRQFFTVKDVPLDAQVIDAGCAGAGRRPSAGAQRCRAIRHRPVRHARRQAVPADRPAFRKPGQPARPGGQPPADTASSLDRLLNAWGVEAPSDKVVLDLRGAWRVRAGAQDRVQAVDYIAWYNLQGDSLNRSDVALAQLDQITVASAGEVRKREGGDGRVDPVADHLAGDHGRWMRRRVRQDPNPTRLLADFRSGNQRHVIAARLRGELASAFPDGPPALAEGQERPAGFPPISAHTEGAANIVVVNDTDILEDRFWVRVQDFFGQQVATPISGNGALVTNLVDTLGGSDALISLRLARREPQALRTGRGYPPQRRCRVPPDRTPAHPEVGRNRAEAARTAPGHACRPRR